MTKKKIGRKNTKIGCFVNEREGPEFNKMSLGPFSCQYMTPNQSTGREAEASGQSCVWNGKRKRGGKLCHALGSSILQFLGLPSLGSILGQTRFLVALELGDSIKLSSVIFNFFALSLCAFHILLQSPCLGLTQEQRGSVGLGSWLPVSWEICQTVKCTGVFVLVFVIHA